MKKIILLYLYFFLILDLLLGFLLKYLNLSFLINPGQIIRGILLISLLIVFFFDIQKNINLTSVYSLLLICYFLIFLFILIIRFKSPLLFFNEFSHISKILFIIILIAFISKHHKYFFSKLSKIIQYNFIIFSSAIIFGYFTRVGLSTYSYIEGSSKGMFYGGNPVSILSLVFFTYYLFNLRFKTQNITYLCIALFNIHIISTKAVFVVPLITMFYLFDKFIKEKLSKKLIVVFAITPFIIIGYFLLIPKITDLYETRYSRLIERSYRVYKRRERVFNTPITAPLEMIAYRRPMAAKMQFSEIFQNPQFIFIGYGHTGQKDFWIKQKMRYHDASMDFFDMFFQYGIFGSFLVFIIIFQTVFRLGFDMQTDRDTIIVMLIFLYSFFGGHVISASTSGTMLALFVGIKHGVTENKKRWEPEILKKIKKKLSWLKN